MKLKHLPVVLACSILLGTAHANASVVFTITGTIQSAESVAFSVSEVVTVTMTVADGLGAPNQDNSATNVWWEFYEPSFSGNVWSNITVSGATGTYNPTTIDPDTWLESGDRRNAFYAAAWDNVGGIGLIRNGEEIAYVDAYVVPSTLVAAIYAANPSVTPENTFVNGIYDVSSASYPANNSMYFYTGNLSGPEYIASISTIQVTGAVVPEPSATALLLGAGSLVLLRFRKAIRA